jgi:NCS1 family nucleobase:cation symporter-1
VYSNWLLGYSSLLGPIAGIMVVDYFLIRRQQLDLAGLYRDDVYPAWNWAGFAAFGVPVVLTCCRWAAMRSAGSTATAGSPARRWAGDLLRVVLMRAQPRQRHWQAPHKALPCRDGPTKKQPEEINMNAA